MEAEMVTITKEQFDELESDSIFLNMLLQSGVDNWEGYDFAVEEYQAQYGDE